MLLPFTHTSESMYTPSNRTLTRFPAASAGKANVFRYQPTPAGKNPPAPRVGLFAAIGPAMLQSCGNSTAAQLASLNAGSCAPLCSPDAKCQSVSNPTMPAARAEADIATAAKNANTRQRFI